jgi:hypothetical protein
MLEPRFPLAASLDGISGKGLNGDQGCWMIDELSRDLHNGYKAGVVCLKK